MPLDQFGFIDYITAVAGLGIAAYALVDNSKAFGAERQTMDPLTSGGS
jgi:hypothetical protein